MKFPTSRLRPISIAIFRAFLALLAAEAVLRLGGWIDVARSYRPLPAGAADGAYRILCTGGCAVKDGWPEHLEAAVAAQLPGRDVRVINAAFSHQPLRRVVARIEKYLELHQPRMVICMVPHPPSLEEAAAAPPRALALARGTYLFRFLALQRDEAAWTAHRWRHALLSRLRPRDPGVVEEFARRSDEFGRPERGDEAWGAYVRRNPDDPLGYFRWASFRGIDRADSRPLLEKACDLYEAGGFSLDGAECLAAAETRDVSKWLRGCADYVRRSPHDARGITALVNLCAAGSRLAAVWETDVDPRAFAREAKAGRPVDRLLRAKLEGGASLAAAFNSLLRDPAMLRRPEVRASVRGPAAAAPVPEGKSPAEAAEANARVMLSLYPSALRALPGRPAEMARILRETCRQWLEREGPHFLAYWGYITASQYLGPDETWQAFHHDIGRTIERTLAGPRDEDAWKTFLWVGQYFYHTRQYEHALRTYSKMAETGLTSDLAFRLALTYAALDRKDLSEKWTAEADRLEFGGSGNEAWAAFARQYRELARRCAKARARLVVVAFPFRRAEPLRRIFGPDRSIIFVDNVEDFRHEMSPAAFERDFRQPAAAVRGVPGPAASRRIAESIAAEIAPALREPR